METKCLKQPSSTKVLCNQRVANNVKLLQLAAAKTRVGEKKTLFSSISYRHWQQQSFLSIFILQRGKRWQKNLVKNRNSSILYTKTTQTNAQLSRHFKVLKIISRMYKMPLNTQNHELQHSMYIVRWDCRKKPYKQEALAQAGLLAFSDLLT